MRSLVVSLSLVVVACGSSVSPSVVPTSVAPSPVVSQPVSPQPAGPAATLEITSFRLGPPDIHHGYTYRPELTLKETTGVGSAEVTSIEYTSSSVTRTILSGQGCLLNPAVTAGGTWDISSAYLYCQDVDSPSPITSLAVEVHYVDAAGNSRTVSGAAASGGF